ncbi:MAG: exodeoxyribonuclease VII large subunit XseA [Idiomarinaceae bacterium HL-53]|nr:MAG: exodeoxyribonuclease VII large subunit XseA [Idiomarinaceae bacterium HL-53]CUS47248.1 Exodeoxyribonuclease VII large subunit [Idiomarinaceae bacterium HL-53]
MQDNRDIFTVSRLNREVRVLLETRFPSVWLVGEISNFSRPGSGHWYFTLKDEGAQISCAMFRGNNQRVQTAVENGLQVIVRARISLYEPRGNYQLIVEHLEPAGAGLLQQQFEVLKSKLAAEGLFAAERKKALPMIRTLGVITSASGAALRDVVAVLKHRDPAMKVIVYPAQVQGTDAPAQLRQALATAVRRNEVDAILLTRGGGSIEDLWAFNDEALARDVADCPLPTLSAVGHEIDFTILDFVADIRAATPSQAAELVSQDRHHLAQQLMVLRQRVWRAWQQQLRNAQQQSQYLRARLAPLNPRFRIERQAQQLDDLTSRLIRSMLIRMQSETRQIGQLQHRLQQQHPARWLAEEQILAQKRMARLHQAGARFVTEQRKRFVSLQQALQLVSPLNVLARGYSMTFDEQGKLLRDEAQIETGDLLTTRFAKGSVTSQVIKKT